MLQKRVTFDHTLLYLSFILYPWYANFKKFCLQYINLSSVAELPADHILNFVIMNVALGNFIVQINKLEKRISVEPKLQKEPDCIKEQ